MYALCKHGPACARYKRGRCTFAHSLWELEDPAGQNLYSRRWVDEWHVAAGRTGIDYFFGQEYSQEQHERIMLYVALVHEDVEFPLWCNMYLWFTEHPSYRPCYEADFGWYSSVTRLAQELNVPCLREVCVNAITLCLNWDPSFVYALDDGGKTFAQRMAERLVYGKSHFVVKATRPWDHGYDKAFEDFATRLRRLQFPESYFPLQVGERCILLSGEFGPWQWVARYEAPDQGGWIIRDCIEDMGELVVLEDPPKYARR